jgi:hypothetical protein
MSGIKGQYVRRYDSIGRPYYVPRAGGQRVSGDLWREERARIARVRKEGAKAAELGEIPETGGPGMPPFPPSIEGVRVSEVGVPEREVWTDDEGVEWDLPEPVQGDDDTG